jgi:hypothetical protein
VRTANCLIGNAWHVARRGGPACAADPEINKLLQNPVGTANTPIITASDAEGAGALFRVSALDFANLPRTPEGNVDFAQDFFHRERS